MYNKKMKKFLVILLIILCVFTIFWFVKKYRKSYNFNITNPVRSPTTGENENGTLLIKISNEMKISSSTFINNEQIPEKYTCDGEGINPPLAFSGIPEDTKNLALIMDDPDAPMGTWDHWVMWNISPDTKEIKENSVPEGAVVGQGTRGVNSYTPPCPPDREHRYFFKLYALDAELNLNTNSTKADLEKAIKGHILDKAELVGRYKRR